MDTDKDLQRIQYELETILLLDRSYWGTGTQERYGKLIDREASILTGRSRAVA